MKITLIYHLYKNSKSIDQSLKSICDQTDKDFELIFACDGATTEVVDKVSDLKTGVKHTKIVGTIENLGHSFMFNYCYKQALGEYIFYFGSTVILTPKFVETIKKFIEKHKDADIITFFTSSPITFDEEFINIKTLSDDFVNKRFQGTNDKVIRKDYLLKNNITATNFKQYPMLFHVELAKFEPKWYSMGSQLVSIKRRSSYTYNIFDLFDQCKIMFERIAKSDSFEEKHKEEIRYLCLVCLFNKFLFALYSSQPRNYLIQKKSLTAIKELLYDYYPNWKQNKWLDSTINKNDKRILTYLKDFVPTRAYVKSAIATNVFLHGWFKNGKNK